MIVDVHNHVWPDHVAPRALAGNVPGSELFGDGTAAGLVAAQDEAGVDLSVCLAVANHPGQVETANAFVGSLDRSRFVPFGTIHPGLAPEDNLASLRAHGVKGVKLHPIFQGYSLDDPALLPVLEALAGEFCVIAHVGEGAGADGTACTPEMVRDIAAAVPSLTLIACHFGGYHRLAQAECLLGTSVHFDTAWPPTLGALDPGPLRDLIRRHGVEKVLFASDWPTASPAAELAVLRGLGLDDDELEAVCGGNAVRLLGLA